MLMIERKLSYEYVMDYTIPLLSNDYTILLYFINSSNEAELTMIIIRIIVAIFENFQSWNFRIYSNSIDHKNFKFLFEQNLGKIVPLRIVINTKPVYKAIHEYVNPLTFSSCVPKSILCNKYLDMTTHKDCLNYT